MLKKTSAAILVAAVFGWAGVAQADLPVGNPSSGFGGWSTGLGSLIDFGGGETTLSFFSAGPGIKISADDCCVVGDRFALILDGVATAWTSSVGPGPGLFSGVYEAGIGAGAHTMSLLVDMDCCGAGSMSWAIAPSAVPEPETYAMLLAGLGLLGFVARRRKQKLAAA